MTSLVGVGEAGWKRDKNEQCCEAGGKYSNRQSQRSGGCTCCDGGEQKQNNCDENKTCLERSDSDIVGGCLLDEEVEVEDEEGDHDGLRELAERPQAQNRTGPARDPRTSVYPILPSATTTNILRISIQFQSILLLSMDALKAELASKRKAFDVPPAADARPTKYMRRGDIERLKEEQERKAKEERLAREREQADKAEAERLAGLNKGKVSFSFLLARSSQSSFDVGG